MPSLQKNAGDKFACHHPRVPVQLPNRPLSSAEQRLYDLDNGFPITTSRLPSGPQEFEHFPAGKCLRSIRNSFAVLLASFLISASLHGATGPSIRPGSQPPLNMHYNTPAVTWDKNALPLGNGYMGALVFGDVEEERLLINEHTLWSGGQGENPAYDGGHSDRTTAQNVAALKAAQRELQQRMTDFTRNHAAHIDAQGKLVTEDYHTKDIDHRWIGKLRGHKKDYGSYQQLSDVLISQRTPGIDPPVLLTSNLFHAGHAQKTSGWHYHPLDVLNDRGNHPLPVWLMAEYPSSKQIWAYTITIDPSLPQRAFASWRLYGSQDGINFTLIDSRSKEYFSPSQERRIFVLKQPAQYARYKLEVTDLQKPKNFSPLQLKGLILHEKHNTSYYTRSLDLDSALARVDYQLTEGTRFGREYLISYPDQVLAVKLTTDKPGSLTRFIHLNTPQPHHAIQASASGNRGTIVMTGIPASRRKGVRPPRTLRFAQHVRVLSTGGTVDAVDGGIRVRNAHEIVLLVTAATNYRQCQDTSFDYLSDADPAKLSLARLQAAETKGYAAIRRDHLKDYQALFHRLKLDLGIQTTPHKTTDRLLADYQTQNTPAENLYLETLYYQFGRYLLLASSRPGSLPANLQGIWAAGIRPPWDADYHTNINLQMNYWPAEPGNLPECHQPLLVYINSLVPRGTFTAKRVFGPQTRGWTTFHENNIWGNTAPAVSGAFYTPTAAAWLAQDLWEAYAFNRDRNQLVQNYPTMLKAALFWVDTLVTDTRDQSLVVSPSYSPEHGAFSLGSAFDQAVVWDLFNNTLEASKILGLENTTESKEIRQAFQKLSGPRIGLGGQFQEWKDEVTLDVTGDRQHRHANHLYALHPGRQIVPGRSPQEDAYAQAMRKTLDTRGNGGTGWSKAWKINFWARLRDGARAHLLLRELLKGSTYPNLFDTHPPFQIDGNFGATAGIMEMLLQSHGDSLELMAAMPPEWPNGSVTGLKARGNVQVDMFWEHSALRRAQLHAGSDGQLRLRGKNIGNATMTNAQGQSVTCTRENDNALTFNAKAGESYILMLRH